MTEPTERRTILDQVIGIIRPPEMTSFQSDLLDTKLFDAEDALQRYLDFVSPEVVDLELDQARLVFEPPLDDSDEARDLLTAFVAECGKVRERLEIRYKTKPKLPRGFTRQFERGAPVALLKQVKGADLVLLSPQPPPPPVEPEAPLTGRALELAGTIAVVKNLRGSTTSALTTDELLDRYSFVRDEQARLEQVLAGFSPDELPAAFPDGVPAIKAQIAKVDSELAPLRREIRRGIHELAVEQPRNFDKWSDRQLCNFDMTKLNDKEHFVSGLAEFGGTFIGAVCGAIGFLAPQGAVGALAAAGILVASSSGGYAVGFFGTRLATGTPRGSVRRLQEAMTELDGMLNTRDELSKEWREIQTAAQTSLDQLREPRRNLEAHIAQRCQDDPALRAVLNAAIQTIGPPRNSGTEGQRLWSQLVSSAALIMRDTSVPEGKLPMRSADQEAWKRLGELDPAAQAPKQIDSRPTNRTLRLTPRPVEPTGMEQGLA